MTLFIEPNVYSAYHLFVIQVEPEIRRQVFEQLRAADVGVNVHYIPVHLQPDYRKFGFKPGDFPGAESYYEGAITLPLHPLMTEQEQQFIIENLQQALHAYGLN